MWNEAIERLYREAEAALPEVQRDLRRAWRIMDETVDAAGLSHGSIYMRWATADAGPGAPGVVWALRHCATLPDLAGAWAATARLAADRIVVAYGMTDADADAQPAKK